MVTFSGQKVIKNYTNPAHRHPLLADFLLFLPHNYQVSLTHLDPNFIHIRPLPRCQSQ